MDIPILLGSLQLALAAIQLSLDHFVTLKEADEEDSERFYELGEAVRILEYALAETVAFIGQTDEREPNPKLASHWQDASIAVRRIQNGADLADIAFEKNLYWQNPRGFRNRSQSRVYRISLENVLIQLRKIREKYDKMQAKLRD